MPEYSFKVTLRLLCSRTTPSTHSTHRARLLLDQAAMAAMMPAAGGANSGNPYNNFDSDAIERDLIDPDDGEPIHPLPPRRARSSN